MSTRISKNCSPFDLNSGCKYSNTIYHALKCKMRYKIQWDMLIEAAIRIAVWVLFIYFDYTDPFIREIHDNEIWKYQFPITHPYVPNVWLWMVIISSPAIIFITDYYLMKNKEDPLNGCLALTLSYGLTGIITMYLKVITGRPRPDFYFRCFPDGSGIDYSSCMGEKPIYLDGRKSFPSGHASLSFACMIFVSLYLGRKFGLFQEGKRGQAWQLCLCLAPLLIAGGISVSRTCDYHHHYEDVAAGSVIGTVVSYLCYKLYFPKNTSVIVQDIH